MTGKWCETFFDQAVIINPPVNLTLGDVYPFVDMQSVDPTRRDVVPSEYRKFSGGGSRFMSGDTLMARITPCLENGKIGRFLGSSESSIGHGSTEFIVIRGREGVTDNGFVYYLTRSKLVLNYAISQMSGTSGRQRVPLSALAHLRVPLPPLSEQRAIAHILGTLDDKIELNRRMSETLEAMARAIFKAWFVDFEPVRAKMEGRWRRGESLPGLPAHLWDLFPDRLVDSELGEIPEGWRVDRMGNHFCITMGQSPPGSTYNQNGDGLPFYQGRVDFGFRFPTRRVFCTAPTRFAEVGDTLVTVRAPVGDTNMALERCCIGRGVAAVRHTTGARSYTYYFVRSLRSVFERFEAEGTVFGAVNKEGFNSIKCVVPPTGLVQHFEELCAPIDEQIETAERESRTLAALRDALLPKLISGEIRVRDAERFLRET
ncbi:MAG: restriction endonuclease subunit S [Caldiserica bacterium]|jgi:type I restriction enzyme S subunit|nr:restriction endonuclease subunit S [Caldisericota bacterium]